MNIFLKFGIFNLLMITGWFDLYGQGTGEKLSEIQKQVDAMMERIQRLKEQKSAEEKPAKQLQPVQKPISSSNPVSEAPMPEMEKSSVDENISTMGGVEQNASLPSSIISEFPIVETFSGTVSLYEESTQSFIPVEQGLIIEKKTTRNIAKKYIETVNTSFEGRSSQLAANILNDLDMKDSFFSKMMTMTISYIK